MISIIIEFLKDQAWIHWRRLGVRHVIGFFLNGGGVRGTHAYWGGLLGGNEGTYDVGIS